MSAGGARAVLAGAAAALVITLARGPGGASWTGTAGAAIDADLVAVLSSIITCGRHTDRPIGAELTPITRAISVVETLEAGSAWIAYGAPAVDVGLLAVLVVIVTSWGRAAAVGVADALLTITVHIARAAVGARGTAPPAVDVGLVAILRRVVTRRPVRADVALEGVTEVAQAVASALALGAVGTGVGTVGPAVDSQLEPVSHPVIAVWRTTGLVAHAARAVIGDVAGIADVASTAVIAAAVGVRLSAIADAVVTRRLGAPTEHAIRAGAVIADLTVLVGLTALT